LKKEISMKNRIASLVALAVLLPMAPAAFAADEAVVQVAANESKKEPRRAPTDEEALALAALEGLINMPPERALPILKRVLSGDQSTIVKKRALFVASQFDGPEAQQLLIDVAKQANNPLRAEAIRNIGIGGNPTSVAVLKEVYANGDDATKRQVLESWLIAGNRADVYQAALAAKTEAEADRAIRTLAAMGARDELRKLGAEGKNSKSLMEAFAVSGDLESLKRIANTAPDPATRAEAVRRMGIIAGPEATKALREAYERATDDKVKRAALDGLLVTGNEQAVLELYKVAKTPEEKRALLRTLSTMGGDAALTAIDQALGGGQATGGKK
jgi:HEAT repeat protein